MKYALQLPWVRIVFSALLPLALLVGRGFCSELVNAKDGSGTFGYKDTPKLPWCEWLVHDADRPAPKRVDPGKAPSPAPIPTDAIVLFDGTDLTHWNALEGWKVEDGCIVAGTGAFTTKASFGKMQLHLEFMAPKNFPTTWDNRGNNGVLLMGLYEIQIFDSYNEKLYPDGQCGAIYGQTPPLVNVTRPPGEWQSFDIVFTPPRFDGETLSAPARTTIFHNGVLVQLNEEIHGETGHRIIPKYAHKVSTGPIALGGHHCPVKFRNIWVRKLD